MPAVSEAAPRRVHVTEVGLRDGLQNEPLILATEQKLALARALIAAGIREFEVTSFVSPRAVPALADAAELVAALRDTEGLHLSALVPNLRGAERALEAGVDSVVLFVSASESHNAKNVNRSVEASLAGFERVARLLAEHDGRLKQSEIVEATDWSKAKVSRVLTQMTDRGYVEKRQDGRQNIIVLRAD
jgi:hydroxymethylglutaryl-CoA lyase